MSVAPLSPEACEVLLLFSDLTGNTLFSSPDWSLMEHNTVLFCFPEDITSDMTSWMQYG